MDAFPEPRYGTDDTLLRYLLWEAWRFRCYWCRDIKDVLEIEIDHIVPQGLSDEELAAQLVDLGLPADYNIHDLLNLAPICGPCNKPSGKGGRPLKRAPRILSELDQAEIRKPRICKRFQSFRNNRSLAKHAVALASANLDDEKARDIFVDAVPGLVQRLAQVAAETIVYTTTREIPVRVGQDSLAVEVRLDERGRVALVVLEELCGAYPQEVLDQPMESLLEKIAETAESALRSHLGPEFDGQVGELSPAHLLVHVEEFDFKRAGDAVTFRLVGGFDAIYTASVVDGATGDLESGQGDVALEGTFTCLSDGVVGGGIVAAGQTYTTSHVDAWSS
jgi:hypothetical protein